MSSNDGKTRERLIKYIKYLPFALIGFFIIILIATSIIADVHNMSYWEAFKGGFSSLGTWGFWGIMTIGGLMIYTSFFTLPRMWNNIKKNREKRKY